MNAESLTQQEIRLAIGGRPDCRLFRNNVGTGWTGDRVLRPSGVMTATVHPGDAIIYSARPLRAGLSEGSPDLMGWRRVLITPAHVGRRLAVTIGLEVKTATGRLSIAQDAFLTRMQADGALAGLTRDVYDAQRIVDSI